MKNIKRLIQRTISKVRSLFIKEKNSSSIGAFGFETSEHDWEQHNDNVSF